MNNNTGTLLSEQSQSISYTAFNKASHISQGDYDYFITYGPDRLRRRSVLLCANTDATVQTKYYLFGDYEKDITQSGTRHLHYISAGDGLAAIWVKYDSGADTLFYVMKDHLGSIVGAINSESGEIHRQSFDAWGRKRNPENWTYSNIPDFIFDRGFTGHEHLALFGLINMNGRLYDVATCRFLSPDPYVQMPDFTQNFNRYSYALNNPLVYTDPSGEFVVLAAILVGAAIGGYSGYKIGDARGAKGLEMFGYIAGGAVIGGAAGWAGASLATSTMTSVLASGGTAFEATISAGAMAGMAGGATSGAGMTALAGGNVSDIMGAATMGAVIGGFTGAVGGAAFHGANSVLNNLPGIISKFTPTNTLAYMASSTSSEIAGNVLTGQNAFSNLSYGINPGIVLPFMADAATYSNNIRLSVHKKHIDKIVADPTKDFDGTACTYTTVGKNGDLNMKSLVTWDVVKPSHYEKQYKYDWQWKPPFITKTYTGTVHIPKTTTFPYYSLKGITSTYIPNYTSYVLSARRYHY